MKNNRSKPFDDPIKKAEDGMGDSCVWKAGDAIPLFKGYSL